MEMTGEQHIAAPRQRVWEALNDPEVLKACIPGCQSLEKEGDRFNAVAEVKIGPIGARFKGTVQLSDLDPPSGYTIAGQGSGGVAGNARGSAKVRLTEDADGTLVSYDVDAEVGGRMAQLGGPIIDATAKQLATRFFRQFGEIVEKGSAPAAPAAETPAVEPAPAAAGTAAAAPLAPSQATAPVPAPAHSAPAVATGSPWAWIVAVGIAVLAGFLLGRSDAAGWWTIFIIVLIAVVGGAAYESGRRAGASR